MKAHLAETSQAIAISTQKLEETTIATTPPYIRSSEYLHYYLEEATLLWRNGKLTQSSKLAPLHRRLLNNRQKSCVESG